MQPRGRTAGVKELDWALLLGQVLYIIKYLIW